MRAVENSFQGAECGNSVPQDRAARPEQGEHGCEGECGGGFAGWEACGGVAAEGEGWMGELKVRVWGAGVGVVWAEAADSALQQHAGNVGCQHYYGRQQGDSPTAGVDERDQ